MNKIICVFVITTAFIFCLEESYSKCNSWEYTTVDRVLGNNHLLDKKGHILKIAGINGFDLNIPTHQERPYARRVFQILKSLIEKESIRVLSVNKRDKKSKPLIRYIKIKQGDKWILLPEWLIRNGYAYYSPTVNKIIDRVLQKAEIFAKQREIGIWGEAEFDKSISRLRESASVMTLRFKKKYGHLSAPISVGRVKRVITGSEIELENGAIVKLLGIQVPSPADTRKAYSCFGENSKQYLESIVLGREIWMERDITDTDNQRRFLRYIRVPGDSNYLHSEVDVNKEMIKRGFAKSYWSDDVDKKFRDEFEKLQSKVYEDLLGAWKYCLSEIVNPAREEKLLVYDEDCRIKGNISNDRYTYHTPESGWYKRIKPERCFINEVDAIDAGFVKIK